MSTPSPKPHTLNTVDPPSRAPSAPSQVQLTVACGACDLGLRCEGFRAEGLGVGFWGLGFGFLESRVNGPACRIGLWRVQVLVIRVFGFRAILNPRP